MEMPKITRIVVLLLLVGILVTSLFGCGSASNDANASQEQVATVQRGDLTIVIAAAGNLALSLTADLAFDMAGTVQEVLVKEGETVTEGQVLASLDTAEWQDSLAALEDQLTKQKRNLPQLEANVRTAETALAKAQESYTWPELEVMQADVEAAKANLQYALNGLAEATDDTRAAWSSLVTRYQAVLTAAEKKLNAMLIGADPEEVEAKELALQQAQWQLEDAQKAVADAQAALDEAKKLSPTIKAPFAGFVTKVNVTGGDEVKKGTVAVVVADPNKFQADILVSEMDISQIEVGGTAIVEVDAISGLSLPAEVIHISPTATIQSGVVNYKVTVEVQSLEAITPPQPTSSLPSDNISSGELPERIKQAIQEGRLTQEQAEEMMKQMQQWPGAQPVQAPTATSADFQLRQGMTVTVSLVVQQKTNVLLVPNSAITSQGGQSYVQVVSPSGTIEQRTIKIGITDYVNTEVTEGLSEGEKVIVPKTTTSTSTTTQQEPRGAIGFFGP